MPKLDNPKLEKFCQEVAKGEKAGAAWQKIFKCSDAASRASASRSLKKPEIADRLLQLRGMVSNEARRPVETVAEEFESVINDAVERIEAAEREDIKETQERANRKSAIAQRLHQNTTVQHIIDGAIIELQRLAATFLDIAERRSFLAMVVRTPIGSVTKDSPLCQSYKIVTNETGGSEEFKMPDKIRALVEDAKLAGDYIDPGTTVNVTESKQILVVIPAAIANPRKVKTIEMEGQSLAEPIT